MMLMLIGSVADHNEELLKVKQGPGGTWSKQNRLCVFRKRLCSLIYNYVYQLMTLFILIIIVEGGLYQPPGFTSMSSKPGEWGGVGRVTVNEMSYHVCYIAGNRRRIGQAVDIFLL